MKAEELPDCFPWSPDGSLCPLLKEYSVWSEVFHSWEESQVVKKTCNRFAYRGVIRSQDVESFGLATLWLLSQPGRRKALNAALATEGYLPVHNLMFKAFHTRDKQFAMILPLDECCRSDDEELWFLDPPRLVRF